MPAFSDTSHLAGLNRHRHLKVTFLLCAAVSGVSDGIETPSTRLREQLADRSYLKKSNARRLKLGDTHPQTLESVKNLISLHEAWKKSEETEKWRAKLPLTEAAEE